MNKSTDNAAQQWGLVGLVDAGLVVLVLGVEARLEVVDERGGRQQLAHHLLALQQQLRARRDPVDPRAPSDPADPRGLEVGSGRRGGRAAAAPLGDLALDVERAALRPAADPARPR